MGRKKLWLESAISARNLQKSVFGQVGRTMAAMGRLDRALPREVSPKAARAWDELYNEMEELEQVIGWAFDCVHEEPVREKRPEPAMKVVTVKFAPRHGWQEYPYTEGVLQSLWRTGEMPALAGSFSRGTTVVTGEAVTGKSQVVADILKLHAILNNSRG